MSHTQGQTRRRAASQGCGAHGAPCSTPRFHHALVAVGLLALSWLTGCATHADRLQLVRDEYFAGRIDTAVAELERMSKKHRRDADVFLLDQAMIHLTSGRPADAERALRKVRDRFDELAGVSAAEVTASMLTDDNARAYSGEDYEQVMIRAMLAISNLMNGGEDATAYALQIGEKQQQIAQRLEKETVEERLKSEAYKQVALAPYIRAMIAEESPLTLDDAVRARVQVASFAPDFRDAKTDLERAQYESPMPLNHGTLYVLALVGRGPMKEQRNAEATQAALLVADRIVSAVSPRGLPPTLAPVPVPYVVTQSPLAETVQVRVGSEIAGTTATIVDINTMARLQQEARQPEILGRAVARRVLKKGIVYGAKEAVSADPYSASSILLNVVGVAWEATETADTRCWGLLPAEIQVLRVPLPAGEHQLELQTRSRSGAVGAPARETVRIVDGRNTYLLANFPDTHLVGRMVVSHGSQESVSLTE
jgi:uncharacterized protein